MSRSKQTYSERAARHPSAIARRLLTICERKQSNLCLSADLTKKADLLRVIEAVAPHVCLVKTHIDIVEDFDSELVQELTRLSQEHNFLYFEDRKFADIGNTVKLQYTMGVHRIASWAHIVNAHALPGDGVVTGLASGIPPDSERGLLLIAEMSSKGSMAIGDYTRATVDMARRHKDFVCGFIAQTRVHERDQMASEDDFLVLSPGVGLDTKGDGMGQQYRTPDEAIRVQGCDICIVGRGMCVSVRLLGDHPERESTDMEAEPVDRQQRFAQKLSGTRKPDGRPT